MTVAQEIGRELVDFDMHVCCKNISELQHAIMMSTNNLGSWSPTDKKEEIYQCCQKMTSSNVSSMQKSLFLNHLFVHRSRGKLQCYMHRDWRYNNRRVGSVECMDQPHGRVKSESWNFLNRTQQR